MTLKLDGAPTVEERGYGAVAEPGVRQRTERARPCEASRMESIGVALPERRVTTEELIARCRRAGRIDLERITGIAARRVAGDGDDSLSFAVRAGRKCLEASRYAAEDLDIIISCSITRYVGDLEYRFEPALSHAIKLELGAPKAQSFDLSNACAGMLTGVWVLDGMIRSGAVRRGMVVSGEYITSIAENAVQNVRTIASSQMASLTVGDSGAAVLLDGATPESGSGLGGGRILAANFETFSDHSKLCIGKPCRNAPGAAMFTAAKKLHTHAIGNAAPVIAPVLEKLGLERFSEIDHVVPHQTSVRAIRQGTKELGAALGGVPPNIVYNLRDFGNTASTTHFVALDRGLREGVYAPEDKVMLLSFASGIVIGSLVFTVGELGAG